MIQPRQAKRMVVVSIVGSTLIVTLDKARTGEWPDISLFVGMAAVYVMLGFGTDLAPTIAGPFALLFFLAILLTKGSFVIDGFEKLTGAHSKAKPKTTPKKPHRETQPTAANLKGR